jgi:hypothetical protein
LPTVAAPIDRLRPRRLASRSFSRCSNPSSHSPCARFVFIDRRVPERVWELSSFRERDSSPIVTPESCTPKPTKGVSDD